MPEIICDTSAVQYLHQTGLLHLLRELASSACIPPAVEHEIQIGRRSGIDLPDLSSLDWITVIHPKGERDTRLLGDMGPGETEVLMLALENDGHVAVIDDAVARKRATLLDIPFTGTLGMLLDAKEVGLLPAVAPILDHLQELQFYLAPQTRKLILQKCGESP